MIVLIFLLPTWFRLYVELAFAIGWIEHFWLGFYYCGFFLCDLCGFDRNCDYVLDNVLCHFWISFGVVISCLDLVVVISCLDLGVVIFSGACLESRPS